MYSGRRASASISASIRSLTSTVATGTSVGEGNYLLRLTRKRISLPSCSKPTRSWPMRRVQVSMSGFAPGSSASINRVCPTSTSLIALETFKIGIGHSMCWQSSVLSAVSNAVSHLLWEGGGRRVAVGLEQSRPVDCLSFHECPLHPGRCPLPARGAHLLARVDRVDLAEHAQLVSRHSGSTSPGRGRCARGW